MDLILFVSVNIENISSYAFLGLSLKNCLSSSSFSLSSGTTISKIILCVLSDEWGSLSRIS